jgi:hypothetical protein
MRHRTVREMMSNEAGRKKFILAEAVFINLLRSVKSHMG